MWRHISGISARYLFSGPRVGIWNNLYDGLCMRINYATILNQVKVTDRFKLRRKRMQGASLMPTNRVNKFLAQAIDARSIDQEKANHVNLVSLCFRDSDKERLVSEGVSECGNCGARETRRFNL